MKKHQFGYESSHRKARRSAGALLAACVLAACGDGPGLVDPVEDPLIEQFLGTWDAEVFDVTSVADTTIVADLMENGNFTINVQPSGGYTATLTFGGFPLVEIGQIEVNATTIVLRPDGGDPATSSYVFVSDDYVRLEGPTRFDFNLDTVLDPAQGFIELQRR